MNKKLSVIIRNKNNSSTILRALDSALNQSLSRDDYEVIVIDDGSTDDSWEKILPYACDILTIRTSGIGAIQALNLGLTQSSSEYFTILDADDELPFDSLENLLRAVQDNHQIMVVYGNYKEISPDSDEKTIDTSKNVFLTIAGGILFKRMAVIDSGLYDTELFFPEYDLLIKLMDKYPVVHLDKDVYSYFRQPNSMTSDKSKVAAGIAQINQKYGRTFPIREY